MRKLTQNEREEIERDAALPQLDARRLIDEEYLERAIQEMYPEVARTRAALAPDKASVFAEAARLLRPGGRAGRHRQRAPARGPHPPQRRPVGGLHRRRDPAGPLGRGDRGRRAAVEAVRENDYEFLTERALQACDKYGVVSVSLVARRPAG